MRPPRPPLDPARAQPSSSRRSLRSPKRSPRLSTKRPSSPDPSSGILALLVTVAGSSSVAASPLDPLDADIPPDFLCPRLHAWSIPGPSSSSSASPQQPSWYWEPCDAAEAASYVDLSSRRRKPRSRHTSNNIADKYTQGPDGRWRKADSWELYGSSSCSPSSDCMDTPKPTEFPVQDDQVSPSTGSVTATSSTSASPSLPPGWDKGKVDDTMTGMILGLSLSLAVALTVFMMGIVRWRQKRQARADKDAEGSSSVLDGESVEESEELKRARTQQRLWAKASAKWVANVRQSARRRRKRMAATAAKDSDGRMLRDAQASSSAVSLARTTTAHDVGGRASSPSSLRSSRRNRTSSRSPSPALSDRHRDAVEPHSASHYPPAYLQSSSSAFPHAYPRWRSHPLDTSPDSHPAPGIPPPPDSPPPCSADRSPPPSLSPLPYEPPVHSAHVAVDDKAVLARLVHLASAPPPAAADAPSSCPDEHAREGPSELRPSVPVLDDDPYGCAPLDMELDGDIAPPSGTRPDRRPGLASQAHDAPHGASPHALGSSSVPITLPLDVLDPLDATDDCEDGEVPSYAEDVRRHRPLRLPPPPTKVPLTGPMFYEYPDEFERDVETVDPPEEPSAPPFEHPSSPPLEYAPLDIVHEHNMAPSAPPLEYVVEEPPGADGLALAPSAPPLDMDADDEDEPVRDELDPDDPDGGGDARSAPLSASPDIDDQGSASASAHVTTPDTRAGAQHAGAEAAPPPQYLP